MTWNPILTTRQLPNNGVHLWQCWSGFSTDVERRDHAENQYLRRHGRMPERGWFIRDDWQRRYWMEV